MADSRDSSSPSDRLREHPEERFADARQEFDLRAAARELVNEPAKANRGHRQKTLYRHGRVTIALFAFEGGATLPKHTAAGVVTINVLEGRLRVGTPDGAHDLPAGKLLVLASGVEHDVSAAEASTMLLQVHLDEPPKGRE